MPEEVSIVQLRLTKKMRVQQGGGSHIREFIRVLSQVGEELLEEIYGVVRLPVILALSL